MSAEYPAISKTLTKVDAAWRARRTMSPGVVWLCVVARGRSVALAPFDQLIERVRAVEAMTGGSAAIAQIEADSDNPEVMWAVFMTEESFMTFHMKTREMQPGGTA